MNSEKECHGCHRIDRKNGRGCTLSAKMINTKKYIVLECPCIECLVKVNCTDECTELKDYSRTSNTINVLQRFMDYECT